VGEVVANVFDDAEVSEVGRRDEAEAKGLER
jgi:hypothetical protein